jgi:hypothetical protein
LALHLLFLRIVAISKGKHHWCPEPKHKIFT